jgi:hypothetical protein
MLAFDAPQSLYRIELEVEVREVSHTQELRRSVSNDDGQIGREWLHQEYNFSPSGTTFERGQWTVNLEPVTNLRLWIKPDKGGGSCHASPTSLILH